MLIWPTNSVMARQCTSYHQ